MLKEYDTKIKGIFFNDTRAVALNKSKMYGKKNLLTSREKEKH